ncbi:rhodanese-like domain-containing protein [Magnetospira sp. QH-2]|uniref:rhodanese-like domain-containing protein n=1 Tax=Magnetospira sp. (strain QH-2) TaxID=1288970 RepID=UPI0003E815AA|nr:rhodanese-like domain-containing protein [Magnetospira sp. QH-2]CCQ73436.1 Conserved protein of unknown function [Magnetospira sp. QH-2]
MDQSVPFNIDVHNLKQLLDDGEEICILDIREPWETAICGFDDSLRISMRNLPERVAELPRDKPMVVMCHHGVRSLHATQWLRHSGIDNAINLQGGIDAWARQVDRNCATY